MADYYPLVIVDGVVQEVPSGSYLNIAAVDQSDIDHGSISGLSDDDHTSYHTDARAATWLAANHETTYNHATYDTAYGWGNHASAGYLTAEADTLDIVTGRGASTANAVTVGSATISDLTSGRVPYASTAGLLVDSAGFVFNGTSLQINSATPGTSHGYVEVTGIYTIGANIPFNWAVVTAGRYGVVNADYSFYFDVITTGTPYAEFSTYNWDTDLPFNMVFQANGGNLGIGVTGPTARLHLPYGTASASTAPLKFISGTLNTTPEAGAVEFLTDKLYCTITTGAARKEIALSEGLTSGRVVYATTNGRLTDSASLTYDGSYLQANGYKSSDGSAGATGTFTDHSSNTVTVKDGLITALT